MMARLGLVVLFVLVALARSAVAGPELTFPVACRIASDCFVQIYVDTDPGPGAKDFGCGTLANDGYTGTAIRIKNYAAMEQGVAVLAAAAGTVIRSSDGAEDISAREAGDPPTRLLAAGNEVVIDHGDGWVTEYQHLKKGSVAVTPGQHVNSGDMLGEVGLSGKVVTPMLRFEVRHNDTPIDPFTDRVAGSGCGAPNRGLWDAATTKAVPYIASGVLETGFATESPRFNMVERGIYTNTTFRQDSAALVFWVRVFGLRADDALFMTLISPSGDILAQHSVEYDHTMADSLGFIGLKRPANGWGPGVYRGTFQLIRDSQDVLKGSGEMVLQ